MQVLLSEKNQPRQANFAGGVEFAGDQQGMKTRGNSRAAEVNFDSHARADRVVLDGEVQFRQQADAGKNSPQRTLAANHLVLNLVPGKTGQGRVQSADAAGNAVFTSESTALGQSAQKTILAGQVLNTTFTAQNQPETVDAIGQTRLQTMAANGGIDTSSGDTLHIEFAPGAPTNIRKAYTAERFVRGECGRYADPTIDSYRRANRPRGSATDGEEKERRSRSEDFDRDGRARQLCGGK